MLNLLLGMSYNILKILCCKFQSNSIKVEDFKSNPINPFNPISTKGGGFKFQTYYKDCLILSPKY